MPDPKPSEKIFLKILGGVQSGAEVSLPAGEYSLGSGPEDDIQFIDVSMTPGHARLRVGPGKIEIRSGTGTLRTANGVQTSGDEDQWQELQPLDVVTTGTTRFALGPPTAQWSTITEDGALTRSEGDAAKTPTNRSVVGFLNRGHPLLIPSALLAFALLAALSFVVFGQTGGILSSGKPTLSDVEATRAAIDKFDFGRSIVVKQEVDGAIYATGYVESNVERRAIVGAIDKTGVQVHLRLGVLQVLRGELDGLIKAENLNVTYKLSPQGDLTLAGTILEEKVADGFLADVHENVVGLNKVASDIKTAKTLLSEIEKLASLSQIDDSVVFRLDRTLVEANGVISVNKVDQWVGFLQAYSKRFGKEIGLRSYVQLEYDANASIAQAKATDAGKPVLLGGALASGPGSDLDINRLKSGDFKISEVFAGVAGPGPGKAGAPQTTTASTSQKSPAPTSKSATAQTPGAVVLGPIAVRRTGWSVANPDAQADPSKTAADATADVSKPVQLAMTGSALPSEDPTAVPSTDKPSTPTDESGPSSGRSSADKFSPKPSKPAFSSDQASPMRALVVIGRHDVGDMTARAAALMARWTGGELISKSGDAKDKGSSLQSALDTLATESLGLNSSPSDLTASARELFARKYLPLFALARQSDLKSAQQCRRGSRLSLDNLPAALFWLDLMSTTNAVTLADFDMDAQGFILEAALNPTLVADCLQRTPSAAALIPTSIYLAEASRNPEFVRFVTRSLPSFALDVTGASLSAPRFIQTRNGVKMGEGAAPDAGSRIDTVGELGVSVLLAEGFGTVVYGPDINWMSNR